MYEIFENLLKAHGETAYKVAKETGIATATLTQWKNGTSTPKQEKLQKIADHFGVTVDYLMTGKNKDVTLKLEEFTPDIRAAARGMMELSEEDKKSAIDMINFLRGKGREAKSV